MATTAEVIEILDSLWTAKEIRWCEKALIPLRKKLRAVQREALAAQEEALAAKAAEREILKRVFRDMAQDRFGPLPEAALILADSASYEQLLHWISKLYGKNTLPQILGF